MYDLAVRHGNLVIPGVGVIQADIGVKAGKIAAIAETLSDAAAGAHIDASGRYVFPGAVDSHFHVGIYRPLDQDARSESASAASGGVTTIMSYFRTGKSYLNKTGAFQQIFPELMALSETSYITDYAYHLAIMSRRQLEEMEWLVAECGITTFKYYMFYKTLDLAGSSSSDGYLMLQESLDFGFLYRLMKEVARLNQKYPACGGVRLSIHCENPEVIPVTTEAVKAAGSGNVMRDYSDSRPGWEEALAIKEVGVLADQTACPVNLLHLSSQEAVDAAREVSAEYPQMDFLMEATLHHLAMSHEDDYGLLGKVNPPVRDRSHVDYLWEAVLQGDIHTVVSDHACTSKGYKTGDLWTAMPGFGGTALMFPVLLNEGFHERGLPLERVAELCALNPARYHGLYPQKGTLMVGSDADLAIVDLEKEREVRAEILFSAQDFTPFEGMRLKGWPEKTLLRGQVIYENDRIVGMPGQGRFLKRPLRTPC